MNPVDVIIPYVNASAHTENQNKLLGFALNTTALNGHFTKRRNVETRKREIYLKSKFSSF